LASPPALLRPAFVRHYSAASCSSCAVIVCGSDQDPQRIGVSSEAGGHLDSQAPCVVYHQISTPDGLLCCSDRYLRTFSRSAAVFISPQAISLEISASSPTRPRNVKMVPVSPKLKTAVWGGQEHHPRFWPSLTRWFGHVHQM
jgi:hypothetical protein